MSIDQKIESILFFKSEPLSVSLLAQLINVKENEISEALTILDGRLLGGVRLLRKNDEVTLGTAPENSSLIEGIIKEELSRDLGKAGLETLSIVLYLGPITRARVDYIRGVNSSFILRHLMVRGLVERTSHPDDQRSFLYRPTFALLAHLGVSSVSLLPEYGTVRDEINLFEKIQKDTLNNKRGDDTSLNALEESPEEA